MSRPAPFSLRLTPAERSQRESQARGMSLSAYIKSVVIGVVLWPWMLMARFMPFRNGQV